MKVLHTRSNDGTLLRLGRWNNDGKQNMLLIHGLGENLSRYQHVAEFFAQQNYRITMVELRGHGKSGGRRGHVNRWLRYVEDIQAAMATVSQPMCIVSHSMGGLALLSTMMHSLHPKVWGVVCSNPLLGLIDQPPRHKLFLSRIFSRIYPWLSIPSEVNPAHLTRDKERLAFIENDPLSFEGVSARWGQEVLRAMVAVDEYAPNYKLPLLMMLGDADHICEPESARQFIHKYGGPVTLKEYPKLYHELFNEPERELVFQDLAAWLESVQPS